MKNYRMLVASSIIFSGLLIVLGCKNPTMQEKSSGLANLYEGPVTTFAASCSGCHGSNGSSFGEEFHSLSDSTLTEKIRNMMAGPGQVQGSTDDDIQAMIDYHRALRADALFLIVNNPVSFIEGYHSALKGNVTPGASVTLQKDNREMTAKVEYGEWTIDNAPKPPFTLIAKQGDRQTAFSFPERQSNQI